MFGWTLIRTKWPWMLVLGQAAQEPWSFPLAWNTEQVIRQARKVKWVESRPEATKCKAGAKNLDQWPPQKEMLAPSSTSVLLNQRALSSQSRQEVGVRSCSGRLKMQRSPYFPRFIPTCCLSVISGSLQSETGTGGSRYTRSYSGRTSHIHTISFRSPLMSAYYAKWFGGWILRGQTAFTV